MKQEDCDFCEEATTGYLRFRSTGFIHRRKRTVYESDNFRVFAGLGPLVEGHLLIATKEHSQGIAGIAANLYAELEQVQEWTRKKLTERYQAPLFFEHGDINEGNRGGACISHTHLHALPVGVDITPDLYKKFSGRTITNLLDLQENKRTKTSYIFVQTPERKRYVFDIPAVIPSQYIRQLVAIKIGKPERWNWRTYADVQTNLRETMRTFYALNEDPFEKWIGRDNWMRQYFDFQGYIYGPEEGEKHDKIEYVEICAREVEATIKMRGTISARELSDLYHGSAYCGDGDDHIGKQWIGPMLVNKLAKWSTMQGRVIIEYPPGKKPSECSWEEKIYRIKEEKK